jgi:hypothetical protein
LGSPADRVGDPQATYKVGEHVRAIAIGIVGATAPTQTEKLDIYAQRRLVLLMC